MLTSSRADPGNELLLLVRRGLSTGRGPTPTASFPATSREVIRTTLLVPTEKSDGGTVDRGLSRLMLCLHRRPNASTLTWTWYSRAPSGTRLNGAVSICPSSDVQPRTRAQESASLSSGRP